MAIDDQTYRASIGPGPPYRYELIFHRESFPRWELLELDESGKKATASHHWGNAPAEVTPALLIGWLANFVPDVSARSAVMELGLERRHLFADLAGAEEPLP